MPFCTYILFAHTQVWPELRNLETIAPATAASRSGQSSKTINGAFPPSSKDSFFRVEEDCFIRSLPTFVEPVKDIFLIFGEVVIVSPTSGVFFNAVMMFTTPGGIPARRESSARAFAVNGVSPGDFATTVHPAARAGATFLVIIAAGKFQGVMRPQTPMGCLIVITLLPGTEAPIVSPYALGASSENHSKKLAAYAASPFASARGFPFSQVINVARSSAFSVTRLYHFRSIFERSLGRVFRKVLNASAAAVIAFSVSLASNSGHVPINLPVDGSWTSKVAEEDAVTNSPLT